MSATLDRSLATPAQVHAELELLVRDAALLQNEIEDAAADHFRAARHRELAEARAFATAEGTDQVRKAIAKSAAGAIDPDGSAEASWQAKMRVLKLIETRANACMNIAKTQARS